MELKNKQDFKVGEYYRIDNDSIEAVGYLICLYKSDLSDNCRLLGPYISNMNSADGTHWIFRSCCTPWFKGRQCRIATFDERNWLDACIKADKLVPKPNINLNINPIYSIW